MDYSNLYIIGTIHGGRTDKGELRSMLEAIHPDRVCVELPPSVVEHGMSEKDPRDEMQYVVDWAAQLNVPVEYIDIEGDNPFREGQSTETFEYSQFLSDLEETLTHFDWKTLNLSEKNAQLAHPLEDRIFDAEKLQQREQAMIENVDAVLGNNETVVLVTGTAHLDACESAFPGAVLPLRYAEHARLTFTSSND